MTIPKDLMYHKFRTYGFLKNLRFFDPFLVLFFREMGLSFLEIGALFSIREVATNLLEIPTGVIADAYGRRKAMLAAFSFYLLSFALFYLFPRFSIYVLAMVLYAFGETFRSGTHKAMILEYLRIKGIEERKVEYYGHTRAASQLGSALAALIAAGLVFYAGSYRIVFLASIVPYILELFLMASYPKELDGVLTPVEGGWKKKFATQVTTTMRDFLHTLREPRLLRGLASSASFDAVFKSTKDYLQPILQAQALALPVLLSVRTDQRVAIVVGVLYFLIYLGTSTASANANRVKERARSLPAAVNLTYLFGVGLLAVAGIATWLRIYPLSIAAFLGLYLLQNLRRPIMVGYLSDLIPHRTMATGLSVESQLRTLLTAGIAPLVGFLADRIGVGEALTIIAVVAVAALALLRVQSEGAKLP
jgi:MFS family permease